MPNALWLLGFLAHHLLFGRFCSVWKHSTLISVKLIEAKTDLALKFVFWKRESHGQHLIDPFKRKDEINTYFISVSTTILQL